MEWDGIGVETGAGIAPARYFGRKRKKKKKRMAKKKNNGGGLGKLFGAV